MKHNIHCKNPLCLEPTKNGHSLCPACRWVVERWFTLGLVLGGVVAKILLMGIEYLAK